MSEEKTLNEKLSEALRSNPDDIFGAAEHMQRLGIDNKGVYEATAPNGRSILYVNREGKHRKTIVVYGDKSSQWYDMDTLHNAYVRVKYGKPRMAVDKKLKKMLDKAS